VRYATNKGFRTGLFVGFGYGCVGTCLTPALEEAGLKRPRWPDGPRISSDQNSFIAGKDLCRKRTRNRSPPNERRPDPERIREANLSYLMLAKA